MIEKFSLSVRPRQRLALRAFSLSIMDFSAPWVPSLDNNILRPLKRLKPVLIDQDRPSFKHYSRWTRSALHSLTEANPKAEEPLWETALAIWRLGQVEPDEEDDGENFLWAQHVEAWLASCRIS